MIANKKNKPIATETLLEVLTKVSLCLLLLFSSINNISAKSAQVQDSIFNSTFHYAATELSATNIKEAIIVADSLLNSSKNNLQKLKSLMLLASLHERKGEVIVSLEKALAAEKISKTEKNTDWTIRISGFLSTTLRGVGLNELAKIYLRQAEELNIKNNSPIIENFIYQEKAYYNIYDKDYQNALLELNKSLTLLNTIPEESKTPQFIATSYYMIGDCYLKLKQYDDAIHYYLLTLEELVEVESELKGFVFSGIGIIKLSYNDLDSAFYYLKKAERYAKSSDNFNLKSEVYETLEKYYKLKQNFEEALKYNKKYLNLNKKQTEYSAKIYNSTLKYFDKERNKNKKTFQFTAVLFILILTGLLILTIYYKRKKTNLKLKYEKVIERLNKKNEALRSLDTPIVTAVPLPTTHKTRNNPMTEETENRLLKGLERMETKNIFLQKDISLAALAVKLNTNQKYLSYVIRTHKEQDFNNYINALRIDYILDKLQNEPVYLDYKIAHLAEECGFSTHSKFTEIFKTQTGMLPSVFIAQHKESQE